MSAKIPIVVEVVTGVANVQVPAPTRVADRLSLRCTLFPSLSKMPTFNKHLPLGHDRPAVV